MKLRVLLPNGFHFERIMLYDCNGEKQQEKKNDGLGDAVIVVVDAATADDDGDDDGLTT